ncbi:MAG: hypothetical protein ACRELX_16690 [Longimicrobiales bacterium]
MTQNQRRAALAAAITILVAAPAMAQEPAPPPADLAGVYTLAQVDQVDLPVQFAEEGECRKEITAATLTIGADNTWTMEASITETCGETTEESTSTEDGNFAATAEGIDFDPDDEEPEQIDPDDTVDIDELASGTLADGVLTVQLEEATPVLVFRK